MSATFGDFRQWLLERIAHNDQCCEETTWDRDSEMYNYAAHELRRALKKFDEARKDSETMAGVTGYKE